MSDIYEDVDGERVEMMVNIYESADCVTDHDFQTNTQQPLQQTGNHTNLFRTKSKCI